MPRAYGGVRYVSRGLPAHGGAGPHRAPARGRGETSVRAGNHKINFRARGESQDRDARLRLGAVRGAPRRARRGPARRWPGRTRAVTFRPVLAVALLGATLTASGCAAPEGGPSLY